MFIVLTLVPISAFASDFSQLQIIKDKYPNTSFVNENGKFIEPNEDNYSGFSYVKFANGVLISVGTFRSLAAASMGNFSHVVLFDADPGVVEFNKKQIEVLKRSESVDEFLSLLAGQSGLVDLPNKTPQNDRALKYVAKLIRLAQNDSGHSFLTNSAKYKKLRQLALDNKILIVQGSLTGDRTMKSLAAKLKELNLHVGVLDVSNSFEYIMNNAQSIRNYTENLEALPFEKSSLVHLTNGGYPEGFRSKTLNAKTYKDSHSKLWKKEGQFFESFEEYSYWIDVLIEDSTPCLKALSEIRK